MGRRAQQKRARKLAEHVYLNQIQPQRLAEELRADGVDVTATLVDTTPGTTGFTVTCVECGRTARMPTAPPAGKVALCPQCIRRPRADVP